MANQKDRVKFNVGGKTFETTASTFDVAGQNSFFRALFEENWNRQLDGSIKFFIDRDPDCFGVLLNLLRTGELSIPHHIPEKLLHREAMFYGFLVHVRSAKWGPFDGNRLHLSQSIRNYAADVGTVIRASPHGGCCVAHGNIVHVYDWMLEEHPPVNLDYQKVNDVGWIDEETFVVAVSQRQGGGGGMGLFRESTGELRHRFQVTCWDQLKGYTAGALCSSSDKLKTRDVIAMEEVNSICVANQYEEFGFLDLRSPREVSSVKGLRKYFSMSNESKVKLALHDGQLFLLTGRRISVFCGPDWELTSRLQRPDGVAICDISLGGDRLFALPREGNAFDIWETPRPPILQFC
ncbi:hypothetical protein RHSIM_Rhsim01G0034900 [Rhododendron simsii]|uniref:BTB domain-containing protein n=1 Tax=Rhododendron simsii TaxID=118357 RepID=A0A834HHK6_RHOSS|nr:hypothetical protein RHSIM_Rhsim01G0034900 [Rhododendron simsii]